MTTPALAPYVPYYASRAPYITPAEYTAAPTAVNATNLVAGGSQAQNTNELFNVIARASSMADTICHQILAATLDVQAGSYRIRNGVIRVPVDNTPLLAVNSVSLGWHPNTMQALTDLSGLWIQRKVVSIPINGISPVSPSPNYPTYPITPGYGQILAEVGYVNGWPNTTLAAPASASATSITVADALGIYPGTPMQVYDDSPGNEPVVVASTYTIGSTTVPLTTGLQFQHAAGVSVSSLPPAIKQAVIHLTSALIKTRGSLSIVAGKLQGAPSKTQLQDVGAHDDMSEAQALLAPYARVR